MTYATLAELIESRLDHYGNRGGIGDTAREFLERVACFGLDLRSHVCRVALIAEAVAVELGMDQKAAFYAGLLHDFGKMLLPEQLFDGHDIDRTEYERVKAHAERGFDLLADHHLFSALVAGLHHGVSGREAYGIESDDIPDWVSEGILQKAVEMAVLVSLADFADAYLHRRTHLHGDPGKPHTPENLDPLLRDRFGPKAPVDLVLRETLRIRDEAVPQDGCLEHDADGDGAKDE